MNKGGYIKVEVVIEIHYAGAARLTQKGSFPLRGRLPEQIALEFWKQIRKKMSYFVQLEKVILNSEQDITELVKECEKQESLRAIKKVNDLPF
jgi:hypothetical protein